MDEEWNPNVGRLKTLGLWIGLPLAVVALVFALTWGESTTQEFCETIEIGTQLEPTVEDGKSIGLIVDGVATDPWRRP